MLRALLVQPSRPPGVGGGGGHPDPEIRGGRPKQYFSAFRASVWSKYKGGPRPLGPLPWLRHWLVLYVGSVIYVFVVVLYWYTIWPSIYCGGTPTKRTWRHVKIVSNASCVWTNLDGRLVFMLSSTLQAKYLFLKCCRYTAGVSWQSKIFSFTTADFRYRNLSNSWFFTAKLKNALIRIANCNSFRFCQESVLHWFYYFVKFEDPQERQPTSSEMKSE